MPSSHSPQRGKKVILIFRKKEERQGLGYVRNPFSLSVWRAFKASFQKCDQKSGCLCRKRKKRIVQF